MAGVIAGDAASVPNVLKKSVTVLEEPGGSAFSPSFFSLLQLLTEGSVEVISAASFCVAPGTSGGSVATPPGSADEFRTVFRTGGRDSVFLSASERRVEFDAAFPSGVAPEVGSAARTFGAVAGLAAAKAAIFAGSAFSAPFSFAEICFSRAAATFLLSGAAASAAGGSRSTEFPVPSTFCSGTAAWNASRHPMTYATRRMPFTVPRRLGGDTSERYRGTIWLDAPTPTPVMSRPTVIDSNPSAEALMSVPIVRGTVVANRAALRPCESASGPMPNPPKNPPATKTETTAPFAALSPANPRSSAMALRGALITAEWYPNRNAPRHAVTTLGAKPGPTLFQSNGCR